MPPRCEEKELLVSTKTYDFVKWSSERTARFPRSYRFVLGERIERNQYDLLEKLPRAKCSRVKLDMLREAALILKLLRFPMLLARDLECLQPTSFEHGSKLVHELGSLLGGIKSVDARA